MITLLFIFVAISNAAVGDKCRGMIVTESLNNFLYLMDTEICYYFVDQFKLVQSNFDEHIHKSASEMYIKVSDTGFYIYADSQCTRQYTGPTKSYEEFLTVFQLKDDNGKSLDKCDDWNAYLVQKSLRMRITYPCQEENPMVMYAYAASGNSAFSLQVRNVVTKFSVYGQTGTLLRDDYSVSVNYYNCNEKNYLFEEVKNCGSQKYRGGSCVDYCKPGDAVVNKECVCQAYFNGKCTGQCPTFSSKTKNQCSCNDGYQKNGDKCECKLTFNYGCVSSCPENSYASSGDCKCDENYVIDYNNNKCKCNAYIGNECVGTCPSGSRPNSNNQCECEDGYKMENKKCVEDLECPQYCDDDYSSSSGYVSVGISGSSHLIVKLGACFSVDEDYAKDFGGKSGVMKISRVNGEYQIAYFGSESGCQTLKNVFSYHYYFSSISDFPSHDGFVFLGCGSFPSIPAVIFSNGDNYPWGDYIESLRVEEGGLFSDTIIYARYHNHAPEYEKQHGECSDAHSYFAGEFSESSTSSIFILMVLLLIFIFF